MCGIAGFAPSASRADTRTGGIRVPTLVKTSASRILETGGATPFADPDMNPDPPRNLGHRDRRLPPKGAECRHSSPITRTSYRAPSAAYPGDGLVSSPAYTAP